MLVGTDFIDCPDCGALCGRVLSCFAFPNSEKKWSGNPSVNFHVDTADTIYKKQLRLVANKGNKSQHITTKQWNAVLANHKKRADNTRPIKVADDHKYGLSQEGRAVHGN